MKEEKNHNRLAGRETAHKGGEGEDACRGGKGGHRQGRG